MGFYEGLLQSAGVKTGTKEHKLTEGKSILRKENPSKVKVFETKLTAQADTVYMPDDDGYQYILTVVDVGSKLFDAQPMEARSADHIILAFERIFRRGKIKNNITYLYTDPGSEFSNQAFQDFCYDNDIIWRRGMVARKNQMSIVEHYNGLLTRALQTKGTVDEMKTSRTGRKWVKALPKVVKYINDNKKDKGPIIKDFLKPQIMNKNTVLFKVGDMVHVPLQQPKDHLTDKRMHGKFRHGDQRFESEPTKIVHVSLHPGQPPRYIVEGRPNVSFLYGELLSVKEYKK